MKLLSVVFLVSVAVIAVKSEPVALPGGGGLLSGLLGGLKGECGKDGLVDGLLEKLGGILGEVGTLLGGLLGGLLSPSLGDLALSLLQLLFTLLAPLLERLLGTSLNKKGIDLTELITLLTGSIDSGKCTGVDKETVSLLVELLEGLQKKC